MVVVADIPRKLHRGVRKAYAVAHDKSLPRDVRIRHGAVLIGKGNKVLETGFNHYSRCHSKLVNPSANIRQCSHCFHAEMDVIHKYVSREISKLGCSKKRSSYRLNALKKIRRRLSKLTLIVVRSNDDDVACRSKGYSINSHHSKPCIYCARLIAKFGIRKVVYSG